ncbi:MAG TPA: MbnP family copper-binding protein [Burkholderiaceae bacterium]|nr:MbnP family copper-binding protein [Burkholderiaceae bacterium]
MSMPISRFNAQAIALMAIPLSLLSACGGGGGDTTPAPGAPRSITLSFSAVAGTTPVKCGTAVTGLGSSNADAQLKDLRFYVSNVKLVRADGSRQDLTLSADDDWNLSKDGNSVTLIDLEDGTGACSGGTAAMNAQVKGTVPAGSYVGVEWTVGVPFAMNHSDYATATRPLDVQAMAWSWQSGRKFAKIEVTDPAGAAGIWSAKTFNVHLGSTGCTGNPASGETVSCLAPNRMAVAFASFNPDSQRIAVDVRALLAGNDVTRNLAGAAGCMSGGTDPECLKVFESLAIDWKADGKGSGLPLGNGSAQTLFKVVSQ